MLADPSGNASVQARPCRPEDIPAVHALLEECPEAASWSLESLKEIFDSHLKYFFIASSPQGPHVPLGIVGFIVGRRIVGEAEVLNLAVSHGSRRTGIASALLQALLEAFSQENVVQVSLEVRESNQPAIRFYQKAGFQLSGKRTGYYRYPVEAALLFSTFLKAR